MAETETTLAKLITEYDELTNHCDAQPNTELAEAEFNKVEKRLLCLTDAIGTWHAANIIDLAAMLDWHDRYC